MKVYNCPSRSEVHKENNKIQEECCLDNIELIEVERNIRRLDYIAYFKDKNTNEYIKINFEIDMNGNIEITKNETDIEDKIFKKRSG